MSRRPKCVNAERPHESLGMEPPATAYHASPRPYRGPVEPLEYPGHFELRKVSRNGGIRWQKAWVNVSHVLAEETVGLERSPTASGTCTIAV